MTKEKITIEYNLNNASPNSVWGFISSPNGLADWFADKVECNGRTYTFYWSASQQTARKTGLLNGVFIRFKWLEEEDPKAFFEFRINVDELTNNVILEITDYAESDERKIAWNCGTSKSPHSNADSAHDKPPSHPALPSFLGRRDTGYLFFHYFCNKK